MLDEDPNGDGMSENEIALVIASAEGMIGCKSPKQEILTPLLLILIEAMREKRAKNEVSNDRT